MAYVQYLNVNQIYFPEKGNILKQLMKNIDFLLKVEKIKIINSIKNNKKKSNTCLSKSKDP